MNKLEKSLCRTCVHENDCSLISNKQFIWSCSEYKNKDAKRGGKKEILTTDFDFIYNEKVVEFI